MFRARFAQQLSPFCRGRTMPLSLMLGQSLRLQLFYTLLQEQAAEQKTEEVKPTEIKPEEPIKKDEGKWYIDVITGLRHNVRETKQQLETLKTEE